MGKQKPSRTRGRAALLKRKAYLAGRLLKRRRELLREMNALVQSRRRLTAKAVADAADAALDCLDQDIEFQLAERCSAAILEIDGALDRLSAGNYGTCAKCGDRIPAARLRIMPTATLCVTCQSGAERIQADREDPAAWHRVSDARADAPALCNIHGLWQSSKEIEVT